MPLVGFKCPIERTRVDFDHFDSCTARNGRPAFPPWLAKAISTGAEGDVRHAGIDTTATRATGCPRQVYIESLFDYIIDPMSAALRTRGTLLHSDATEFWDQDKWYTEANDPLRMTLNGTLGGFKISMLADAIRKDLKEISDLKFPMDFAVQQRRKGYYNDKHIPQMNLGRILLGQQEWAIKDGYDPDDVMLTIWDHACGKNDGPTALAIPHVDEATLLALKPGGGEYTVAQILELSVWMQEREEARLKEGDTVESRERLAASLPLVGEQQFNGKKCPSYCDVEEICSGLVRKYGRPEVSFDGDDT